MLKVKKRTSKAKIGSKETITSVMKRISNAMSSSKSKDARRLYTLAKTKWGKKFTKFYTAKTSKKLTKKDAKKALEKKKASNKKKSKEKKAKEKAKKYAKKNTTFKDSEVFTPIWNVWISGTKLNWDKKNLITSLQVKETVDGSDTAVLQITDPNFAFINDNIFAEDNTITIKMGWSAYTHRCTFKGYISAVDVSFGSDGRPTLTINCMDNTYRMFRKDRSKTWKNKTSKEIVKKICKRYGYKCVVEKGYKFKKQENISQSNQSDIEFIQKLAQDETRPFTARLVGKKFYYVKKGKMKTPKFILHYKEFPSDVISFSPRINKFSKTNVKKAKTDKKNKTTTGVNLDLGTPKIAAVSSGSTGSVGTARSSGNSNTSTPVNTGSSSGGSSSGGTVTRDVGTRTWG